MKKHYSKIWTHILLAVWGIMSGMPKVSAADFQNQSGSMLNEIKTYLKGTGQEAISLAANTEVPVAPEFVGWDATGDNLLINGGVSRQFSGHTLVAKLGFIRGNFDSYTQTYKTETVVTVYDWTANIICPYYSVGQNMKSVFGDLEVQVIFNGQTVEIQNNKNTSEQATIQYSDLVASWTSYASGNCSTHLGTKYCLVPQYLWNGVHRFGFVATTNTPLYYTTNLPQDFIELYKQEPSNINYKPIAYSLALRLAFILSPDQKNSWQIRPMTSEEVGEAMLNRARTYAISSGNLQTTIPDVKR
ncbi:MAG TPA: hypothetical protein DCL44_02325 [Elusimicrobia bacterium]|nr:hypothetical protein [Elusimicrobiota bacterium]